MLLLLGRRLWCLGRWLLGRWLLWLLLGHPDVPSAGWRCCCTADPVAASIGDLTRLAMGRWNTWMTIGREVLIKFIDVKSLDVRDDIAAEFANVHISEVNVGGLPSSFLQRAPFSLQVLLARLDVSFRGSRRGRWALRLACRK